MNRVIEKTNKKCFVCGKDFLGTEGALTCSSKCRTKLSRFRAKGRKPEFYYTASGNGRKMPDMKRKPEMYRKNKKPENELKIEPPKDSVTIPEISAPEVPIQESKELTVAERLLEIARLEKEIKSWKERPTQGHPKTWALTRDSAIYELNEQINKLK